MHLERAHPFMHLMIFKSFQSKDKESPFFWSLSIYSITSLGFCFRYRLCDLCQCDTDVSTDEECVESPVHR